MGPGALDGKAEGEDEVLAIRFIGAKHGMTRYYYRYDIRSSEVFGDTMQHYCVQHGLSKQFGEGRVHFYFGEARFAECLSFYECLCLSRLRAHVHACGGLSACTRFSLSEVGLHKST